MKGFILNGAMFRVLATWDVLQAYHVFGNWRNTYAIWESAEGWHVAIKITGSWNKLRVRLTRLKGRRLMMQSSIAAHQPAGFA
ncbi:hypothetical protein ACLHOE_003346 [Salmonella enterica subsp. enterica serovar Newport]|nr:hypothetical protein [Salmonella enterica subsp. enterica serovar Shubra]ECM2357422.1 hypothetical protein [Salmonella enterica subsp. enterica serovar Newport]EDA0796630.1 hypothetical protein [Salmonella enterica]EDA4997796.1 hypothetical protein [Salmonella enterica subsp. enterica serovar Newport]EDE2488621.1 hypothetical protein [Salmonella enterica subsp. enterica serovar Shubra]